MEFVAIDVETANANMGSICSIGAASFEHGEPIAEWYSLIDPEDYFDPVNISIHGIDEAAVEGAPAFSEVASHIGTLLADRIVLTHTHFDRVALHQASSRAGTDAPSCKWLDSARVARRTWQDCARSGYGLSALCRRIGYEFEHHNALEDAKAAGRVLLAAMAESGLDLDGVLKRVTQPLDPTRKSVQREGNPDGPLYGEVIAFTGSLDMPRVEAADQAASAGCEVTPGVTKKTTLLVVGNMDVMRLAGNTKSSKHRKAEALISNGQSIRIISENDFGELVTLSR